jgi:hypothetical protein
VKDVSIEYAHIYSNSEIREEHQTAIDVLDKITKSLMADGKKYSLVVLIDDYSFPDPTFDYNAYVIWLAEQGFKPNFIYRESQLIPLCDQVISMITDKKLKMRLIIYIRAKKYPCSLFIAAWYLLRLGALKHPAFNENIAANRLVNILPESFKPFEDDGLNIIKATKYVELVKKIEYEFIEGRLLA